MVVACFIFLSGKLVIHGFIFFLAPTQIPKNSPTSLSEENLIVYLKQLCKHNSGIGIVPFVLVIYTI
ncbi:hypothetical protein A4R26_26380 [Niastella populi]|uniref:Uncharacterized protein n=1 Tax=Niastella populi TaxID=550983 RepID=A0A1V9FDD9_9BACT|nr:hypothetical protein A4R26_26380 [Niastella populi]